MVYLPTRHEIQSSPAVTVKFFSTFLFLNFIYGSFWVNRKRELYLSYCVLSIGESHYLLVPHSLGSLKLGLLSVTNVRVHTARDNGLINSIANCPATASVSRLIGLNYCLAATSRAWLLLLLPRRRHHGSSLNIALSSRLRTNHDVSDTTSALRTIILRIFIYTRFLPVYNARYEIINSTSVVIIIFNE